MRGIGSHRAGSLRNPPVWRSYLARALNDVDAGLLGVADGRVRVLNHLGTGRFDAERIRELDPVQ